MSDNEYEPSDEELWSYSKQLYAGMPLGYIQRAVQIYRKDIERGFPLMKELMAREEERLASEKQENEELATLPRLDSCDAFDTEIPAEDLKNYLEEKEKQEE